MAIADIRALLGMLLIYCASFECAESDASMVDNGKRYPLFPLSISQFKNIIMEGQSVSRPYYETYALQPTYFRPVLRKVVTRWTKSHFGNNTSFHNDYAGWYQSQAMCTSGVIDIETVLSKYIHFKFQSIYPTKVDFIGTIFSSHPSKYFINWYCPEKELVKKRCRKGVRMGISSPDGPDHLPWHLIVEDLRKNHAPQMDDLRWMMTYDAPEQCPFQTTRI